MESSARKRTRAKRNGGRPRTDIRSGRRLLATRHAHHTWSDGAAPVFVPAKIGRRPCVGPPPPQTKADRDKVSRPQAPVQARRTGTDCFLSNRFATRDLCGNRCEPIAKACDLHATCANFAQPGKSHAGWRRSGGFGRAATKQARAERATRLQPTPLHARAGPAPGAPLCAARRLAARAVPTLAALLLCASALNPERLAPPWGQPTSATG